MSLLSRLAIPHCRLFVVLRHTIASGVNDAKAVLCIGATGKTVAELLGASEQMGSVQAGRFADLVATATNPLDDPSQLTHVNFVMKGGVVYRSGGAATAMPN